MTDDAAEVQGAADVQLTTEPEETEDSEAPPETVIAPLSFWQRALRWFRPSPEKMLDRLAELTGAIEHYPESPSNYVLRGEFYVTIGRVDLAEQDFLKALEIANEQLEHSDWGVVAQVMRDRAEHGLRKVGHHGGETET